ncbi:MAG: hypothetical protein IPO07_06435 [Haliscomenobacter sp.]|nr:hypothetical protein [Haliscomenobacter sp.]
MLSLLGEEWQGGRIRLVPGHGCGVDHGGLWGVRSGVVGAEFCPAGFFESNDLDLGIKLWEAYRSGNFERLLTLSHLPSPCFRHLPEVSGTGRSLPSRVNWVPRAIDRGYSTTYPQRFQCGFCGFGQEAGGEWVRGHAGEGDYERVLGMEELI